MEHWLAVLLRQALMDFQLNLDREKVDQAFPVKPVLVEPQAPVREVLLLMRDKNRGSVLVCRSGKLIGIFTERDALKLMARDADMDVPIEQVMTRGPDTLSPEDPVGKAISKMSSEGYRRLPIVDHASRPIGVLRATGILHYLVEHFPQLVYTLPPKPHHKTQEREGA